VREREHDVHVDIRRGWLIAEVIEGLDHFGHAPLYSELV